jgi:hypothetical protein
MNVKRVFDISQTAARDKSQSAPLHETRELLKALMSNSPAPIKLAYNLGEGVGAHYNDANDVIEVARGLDGDSLYRCLAQEASYATLAHKNADEIHCTDKGFSAYCASFALCIKHGIETKGYDFSEVKSYFAGREGKEIRGELKQIRDTVNDVATRMARTLNPPEKQAKSQEAR